MNRIEGVRIYDGSDLRSATLADCKVDLFGCLLVA